MSKNQIFWNFIFTVIYILLVILSGFVLHFENRLPTRIGVFDSIILSFAVFRLVRLFVYDWVTKYIRDYFEKFEKGPRRTLADLLECPWCTGVWMAFFVSFFYFLSPIAWYPIFLLSLSGAATYLQIIIIRIGKDL